MAQNQKAKTVDPKTTKEIRVPKRKSEIEASHSKRTKTDEPTPQTTEEVKLFFSLRFVFVNHAVRC